MNLVTKISIVTATTFLLSACGSAVQPQQSVFTPIAIATPIKPAIQELHMTIQQGVTTKKQILDALGQPNDYVTHLLGYHLTYSANDNKNRIIYLTYIEKDNTTFSYTIGEGNQHQRSLIIGTDKKNLVDGIIVY